MVSDVVVEQGEAVDELQGCARGGGPRGLAAGGFAGEQTEGGTDPLAPRGGDGAALGISVAEVVAQQLVEQGIGSVGEKGADLGFHQGAAAREYALGRLFGSHRVPVLPEGAISSLAS